MSNLMKRRRRRPIRHNHFRSLCIWAGLIITSLLLLFLRDEVKSLSEKFQSEKKPANQATYLPAAEEPLFFEDLRRSTVHRHRSEEKGHDGFSPRFYPFSVVDGGVHSVQELKSAVWRDPVVAKHYSNFELDRAKVVEARADADFHVSYRIGDQIFWTKKRLRIARGETLITDGTNFTRTRCANLLSERPRGKTSPDEPEVAVFDTPMPPLSDPGPLIPPGPAGLDPSDPGDPTSKLPDGPAPPPSDPTSFIPPVPIPGIGPTPIPGPNPDSSDDPPPAPVPEPTTLLLLGTGLAGLWRFRKIFKR